MKIHLCLLAVVAAHFLAVPPPCPAAEPGDAFAFAQRIGRGMNLGNALDAPSEGAWGVTLREGDFAAIRAAGFQSIRLPVKWTAHVGAGPKFAIDPKFLARVDWAVDQALGQGLVLILNVHHDDEIIKEPEKYQPRLEAIWRQLAAHFKDRPDGLAFELLNEPHSALTDEKWQAMIPGLLAIVRGSNPRRAVIVGPGHWNNIDSLMKLRLPEGDRMLIATFHDYNPFHFTHQGAEWSEGSRAWLGETWTGTPAQVQAMARDFDRVATWSKEQDRPVFLGEFGAYNKADLASRTRWTAAMARSAEARGFAWAYWEFKAGFGAFDPQANAWREPLRDALVPPAPPKAATP